jgi:hypothetical protein
MGLFGNYKAYIPVPAGASSDLKVEAFSYSPKGDNSFEGYALTNIKLKTIATSNVSVAFVTNNDCVTTTSFQRSVIKSSEPALVSILELLKGATTQEKAQGANELIPTGTQVNSIRLTGDTVYVDFNFALDAGVGGSCRVTGIRSEIIETLKQFSNIKNVVISINGRTEDILQP